MVIDWLGHSCFKVTLKTGEVVLFDPFDNATGYTQPDVTADYVVVSHGHSDHNDISWVGGDFTLINSEGIREFGDITFEGINTWHDHAQGALRGSNLVFKLSVRGITLTHMGDIGCIPSDAVIEKIYGSEVLLIPVGGNYTINAGEALQICEKVEPNVIIPMHFKTPDTTLDIAPLHYFIEAVDGEYDISYPGKNYLQIDKGSLKKRTRIVVMEYL